MYTHVPQNVQNASQHSITLNKPAVDFFNGALLGNGAMGAVVCSRPDGVMVHFGHNDVWDIRLCEEQSGHVKSFDSTWDWVKRLCQKGIEPLDDEEFRNHLNTLNVGYYKPYPRPFPCGTVILGLDRREYEVLGHSLDISNGICDIFILSQNGNKILVRFFTDMTRDRLWITTITSDGNPAPSPFNRIKFFPDPQTPQEFPPQKNISENHTLAFEQILPALESCQPSSKDKAFRLEARVNQPLVKGSWAAFEGNRKEYSELEKQIEPGSPLTIRIDLHQGLRETLPPLDTSSPFDPAEIHADANTAAESWKKFWSRSSVALKDQTLEAIWYRNLYFINCSLHPRALCPGLFANWSYRDIGTAWHGDYHLNYNTQQIFWCVFSSNHVDKHIPYVNLVHFLMPLSQKWAKEYYGLEGAYFPHSAYPVEMNTMPYPLPHMGWEVCETPWTVQSLWWHYTYTRDVEFLKNQAFAPIREAVRFLVAYMMRPEARGPEWGDDTYHLFPTVCPEVYLLKKDLKGFNSDCLADLTLIKHVFNGYLEAVEILGAGKEECQTVEKVRKILEKFPSYPRANTPNGEVFLSVPAEDPEIVFNCPVSTMPIFPGEEIGLSSPEPLRQIALNSLRQQQNEGGNDLVHLNMQAARMGVLDLEKFKRQIHYCTLPNGTAADLCLQSKGRYHDDTPLDFMGRMGIWDENFALPGVINECLMQSWDGVIRLFPNWDLTQKASFHHLRAKGAFLVSASCADGKIMSARFLSETDNILRFYHPTHGKNLTLRDVRDKRILVQSTNKIVECSLLENQECECLLE